MDLLQQEINKNKDKKISTSKKIVLVSLILCIVLLVLILLVMFLMSGEQTKNLSLTVNGSNIQITSNMFITDENGITYISLGQLSDLIGYNYLRGGYLEYIEDSTKCYLYNINQIIGFETNSDLIYKTSENSNLDYQYYKLKNKIISNNQVLYISLEDLSVGCNVIYSYSKDKNAIIIETTDNYIKNFNNSSIKLSIDDNFNNKKAISYGMLIVSNDNQKLGIVDLNFNTVIGAKYSSIEFDEYTQNFIISDDGKYGVISTEKLLIEPKYQELSIINYSPLLYKVKLNNKYGILDENGDIVINNEYDQFGSNNNIENNFTLIIKDIGEKKQTGIIAIKNGKYGLINIETGNPIVDCKADTIYYNNEENTYYVQEDNKVFTLDEYINYLNTTVVNF